jgi:hypothetical protein
MSTLDLTFDLLDNPKHAAAGPKDTLFLVGTCE